MGDDDGVDQHDKNVLVVRGFFCLLAFCFGRASSLQESSKDYSLSKSNRKSDNVGLPLGSIRLVDSPYRLVAIQRHQTARYGVKYSALYFTWKYCRKRKIERILSLVAKNYYIILQIKNISQKTIIDFCLKLILSPVLASVWSFRLKRYNSSKMILKWHTDDFRGVLKFHLVFINAI